MGRIGRTACVAATLGVCLLLVVASLVGNDSWFPAAPFRMFARASTTDGNIKILRVEAVDANMERFLLTQDNSGIRWAEVEGHARRMRSDPNLVRKLGDSYAAPAGETTHLLAIEVIYTLLEVKNGSLTGQCREVVEAAWYLDGPVPPSDGSASPSSCARGITSTW